MIEVHFDVFSFKAQKSEFPLHCEILLELNILCLNVF